MADSSIQQATCTKCNQSKPTEEFHPRKSRPMGRSSWCKKCVNNSNKARNNSPEGRERDREYRKLPKYRVRINERNRSKYSREYENERKARYRQDPRFPERRKAYNAKRWIWRIKDKYGLTREEFERMNVAQNGLCAICHHPQPGKRPRLHVDHDHQTQKVRGLLCSRCNTAIGNLRDNPEIAQRVVDYLLKHRQLKLVV